MDLRPEGGLLCVLQMSKQDEAFHSPAECAKVTTARKGYSPVPHLPAVAVSLDFGDVAGGDLQSNQQCFALLRKKMPLSGWLQQTRVVTYGTVIPSFATEMNETVVIWLLLT